MTRLLVFGSSARRGATGWQDAAAIRALYQTARPHVVIHGASPSGGADALSGTVAEELAIPVDACPMDPRFDGDGRDRFFRRNARMHKTKCPTLAAGFIAGAVGSPWSNGSAHMADICLRARTPLVIYRDDGQELPPRTGEDPDCPGDKLAGHLHRARILLRGLWVAAPEDERPAIEAAGRAVAVAHQAARGRAPTSEVQALALCAVELTIGMQAGRWSPWAFVATWHLRGVVG